ncbi:YncE family protein [Bacteroides congonensis]|uniref:hypothetical protein n=1 Tax=Bacteroides congonensis TaxID=1871006 RepID=UPI0009330359|nr:hypothetical protein [Bacteroides congonensis]
MKKNFLFYAACALTFVLGSCSDEMFDNAGQVNEPSSQNTRAVGDANWSKAYVLCEGTWKQEPPSLPGRLITYDNNWIGTDTLEVGDTGNDLIQYGSKLYCAVSGHDLTADNGGIWVLNAATGVPCTTAMKQYDDPKNGHKAMPRRLAAYGGEVYVSLYSGAVMVIDTIDFEMKNAVPLNATYSEGICVANNTVYVCNSGNTGDSYAGQGTTISRLTTDLEILEPITVPTNPKLIAQAPNGTLYFNSLGNYTTEKSALYKLEGEGYSHVANLADAFKIGDNAIYTTYVDWYDPNYEMPTTLQKVSFSGTVTPFTTDIPDLMLGYSVSVNPFNGDVCFGQSGQNLYVYESDGTPIRVENPIETGTANVNTVLFIK